MSADTATAKTAPARENEPVLLRQDRDGVATLTLNRPKSLNALSEALLAALAETLHGLAEDTDARVVVIAGAGRAFSAGHDLGEMLGRKGDQDYFEELFKRCSAIMSGLLHLPQPVIAKVHGIATAAGCQLVAACDLAVAAESARFATSGINAGLFCMTPGVAVARNLGRKQAFEMLFTGDFVDARTAQSLGLVNRVVPDQQLDAEVEKLCGALLSKSSAALAAGKRVFYRQIEMGLEGAYELAAREMACNMLFEDAEEGIGAFLEKRKPAWRHK
ncbi:MAG: enoyl-CoA hydratase [Kiloniellales bacterium]